MMSLLLQVLEYWDYGNTDYVESMKKGWQSIEWMKKKSMSKNVDRGRSECV